MSHCLTDARIREYGSLSVAHLPCFYPQGVYIILLSLFGLFSKITKFRYIVIFTKISPIGNQNSHKEEDSLEFYENPIDRLAKIANKNGNRFEKFSVFLIDSYILKYWHTILNSDVWSYENSSIFFTYCC